MVRQNVGIGLWIVCIFSFIAAVSNLEPIAGLHAWLLLAWTLGKTALFGYAAVLLLDAHEEIETLKATNRHSERIIEELLDRVNSPRTS